MLTVEKAFTTRAGRFSPGQVIQPGDLAGDVVPLADRQARGFVSGGAQPAPAALAADSGPVRARPAARAAS